jgi:hypothetical protein
MKDRNPATASQASDNTLSQHRLVRFSRIGTHTTARPTAKKVGRAVSRPGKLRIRCQGIDLCLRQGRHRAPAKGLNGQRGSRDTSHGRQHQESWHGMCQNHGYSGRTHNERMSRIDKRGRQFQLREIYQQRSKLRGEPALIYRRRGKYLSWMFCRHGLSFGQEMSPVHKRTWVTCEESRLPITACVENQADASRSRSERAVWWRNQDAGRFPYRWRCSTWRFAERSSKKAIMG